MKKFYIILLVLLSVSICAQERTVRKMITFSDAGEADVDTSRIATTGIDTSDVFKMWSHTSLQYATDTTGTGNAALKLSLWTSSTYQEESFKLALTIIDSTGGQGELWFPILTLEAPVCKFGKLIVEGLTTNDSSKFWGWVEGWSNDVNANGR